ncbi:MAG: hypothetical protein WB780_10310 [Candidatus Acidiferrales bacterium]
MTASWAEGESGPHSHAANFFGVASSSERTREGNKGMRGANGWLAESAANSCAYAEARLGAAIQSDGQRLHLMGFS